MPNSNYVPSSYLTQILAGVPAQAKGQAIQLAAENMAAQNGENPGPYAPPVQTNNIVQETGVSMPNKSKSADLTAALSQPPPLPESFSPNAVAMPAEAIPASLNNSDEASPPMPENNKGNFLVNLLKGAGTGLLGAGDLAYNVAKMTPVGSQLSDAVQGASDSLKNQTGIDIPGMLSGNKNNPTNDVGGEFFGENQAKSPEDAQISEIDKNIQNFPPILMSNPTMSAMYNGWVAQRANLINERNQYFEGKQNLGIGTSAQSKDFRNDVKNKEALQELANNLQNDYSSGNVFEIGPILSSLNKTGEYGNVPGASDMFTSNEEGKLAKWLTKTPKSVVSQVVTGVLNAAKQNAQTAADEVNRQGDLIFPGARNGTNPEFAEKWKETDPTFGFPLMDEPNTLNTTEAGNKAQENYADTNGIASNMKNVSGMLEGLAPVEIRGFKRTLEPSLYNTLASVFGWNTPKATSPVTSKNKSNAQNQGFVPRKVR